MKNNAMEIVKYLCEFFFTDFWHWLGLLFVLSVIFGMPLVYIGTRKNKKEDE